MSYICDTCPGGDCDNCQYSRTIEIHAPDKAYRRAVNAFTVADNWGRLPDIGDRAGERSVKAQIWSYIPDEYVYETPYATPAELVYEVWKNGGRLDHPLHG